MGQRELILRADRQPVLLRGAGVHLGLLAGAALLVQDGSVTMKDHVLCLCPRVLHRQFCRHLDWFEEKTRLDQEMVDQVLVWDCPFKETLLNGQTLFTLQGNGSAIDKQYLSSKVELTKQYLCIIPPLP